jgi:iron complex outermembrane receptor protein
VCALAAIVAFAPCAARAAGVPDDPFSLLQEQQTVTGASQRPEPVWESPSAVTVLTAAEIRTNGYHTLGEALAWVRGLYTRYDRNYTFLGVRGLQRPGDYNNKVLLTIDGHALNSPIFGDAPFGGELGLDLERVERIEVIRGPGSALYGSNAVLAVINVVTRDPAASPGFEADVRDGAGSDARAFVTFASARGDLPHLALSGSLEDSRGFDLYYPEFAATGPTNGFARSADGERAANFLGGLDWRGSRLTVKVNERLKHVPTGSFGTTFGDPRTETNDGHDYVELSTQQRVARTVGLGARAYWDASRYSGDYIYGPDSATTVEYDLGYSDLFGAETRLDWRPTSTQVVTAGTEGRWVTRARQYPVDVNPFFVHVDVDEKSSLGAAYAQDEVQVGRLGRITGGLRLDSYSKYGNVASPRLDLVLPAPGGAIWKLLAGSAYRAPVPFETQSRGDDQVPNPNLRPERLTTLESDLVRHVGPASVTLSVYRNWIRDLVNAQILDTLGTFTFANSDRVVASGAEAELEVLLPRGARARADVACQKSVVTATGAELSDSPRWNGHLVLTRPALLDPFSFGAGLRWLSSRSTLRSTRLPSFVVVDGRVGLRGRSGLELGLEFRNLFNAHYADPAAAEHVQDALPQDGRELFLTVGYRRAGGS